MIFRKRIAHYAIWNKKSCIDRYAELARKTGLRSRAWFKLKEIDRIDQLFKIGMSVIDLGSAPGGWSVYVSNKIGKTGKIVACDRFPMKKIDGVKFLQVDCFDPRLLNMLSLLFEYKTVQIVLSDMSPSTTGISLIDVNKSILLADAALEICNQFLSPGGTFLVKIFHGANFEKYLYSIKSIFNTVRIRKPSASRMNSREVYIVAKELKTIRN